MAKKRVKNNKVSNTTDSKTILLKWASKILFVILVLLCLFIIYYIISVKVYRNTGYKYRPFISMHSISSESMEPNYNINDVVIDYIEKNPKNIKVGDVITFLPSNFNDNSITMTHRVVEVVEIDNIYYYKTKGDNNLEADEFLVSYDNVLGKVLFKIPYVGKLQFLL